MYLYLHFNCPSPSYPKAGKQECMREVKSSSVFVLTLFPVSELMHSQPEAFCCGFKKLHICHVLLACIDLYKIAF